ncbi:baseplate J/gp47 family protein [Falsiroseomonas sp.]|uniref:baseplate J/gp47 family protein n=1 Tax=Falsiroseomonas sp. TaxID=2870721 RepID=UPI003F70965C
MTYPLPTPDQIAERLAVGLISQFPEAEIDPRAPDTVLGVLARTWGMTLFDAHLFLRWLADQLMADTATEWLPRLADIWGIYRTAAQAATGPGTAAGVTGTPLPAGLSLRAPGGALFVTLATAAIGGDGTATVQIQATTPGAGGNLGAGTVLTLVSPVLDLNPQSVTVAAPGLSGGADEEDLEALRARVLARIRQPSMGGATSDYEDWARAALAGVAQVAVLPGATGPGTVSIVIAMDGPRAPTTGELATISAHVEPRRPVTAAVSVLPVSLSPVAFSIRITPDTLAVRNAVTAALDGLFAREAAIGGTLERSRLSEAISSANGEYSHEMTLPAADVTATASQLRTRGTITWLAP